MKTMMKKWLPASLLACVCLHASFASDTVTHFRVMAFFTAKQDLAHISFVHEANQWFSEAGSRYGFQYDSTSNWNLMTDSMLSRCDVVVFLDTRPDSLPQRTAFKHYLEHGGAWMGFHFAGFALSPSAYPQNWDWYHQQFLGSGQYKGNTWRPTAAVLRVEDSSHPVVQHLPAVFISAPNEWYSWENNLRANPDIKVLVSIDAASFPLGTGPKPHEIWQGGDYPVVWTNTRYRMLYLNMGHNDMDYEGGTNRSLSSTFSSPVQNQLLINGLMWLGKKREVE